jgi:hypothetical protein
MITEVMLETLPSEIAVYRSGVLRRLGSLYEEARPDLEVARKAGKATWPYLMVCSRILMNMAQSSGVITYTNKLADLLRDSCLTCACRRFFVRLLFRWPGLIIRYGNSFQRAACLHGHPDDHAEHDDFSISKLLFALGLRRERAQVHHALSGNAAFRDLALVKPDRKYNICARI